MIAAAAMDVTMIVTTAAVIAMADRAEAGEGNLALVRRMSLLAACLPSEQILHTITRKNATVMINQAE